MCRRLIYLVSFILMLGSVSQAEDIQWTDLGPGHLWSTPANWDLGRVPTLTDEVRIDVPAAGAPNGPVIQDGIDAKAKGIFTEAPGEPTLTMTGGTLEVAEWIWWGDGADSFGIWTMSGGTVDVANEFELGWGGGAGTLIMTGGTINAGEAVIPTGSGAFGELFLHGGTYNVTKPGGLDVKENGLIDVTEGTLVLEGDQTAKINELIAAGRITAYDGRGQFELDYDERNPGKTMLTAVGRVLIVEAGGDIAAANAIAEDGDTIEITAGTYYLTSQIEIKDGVTYRGAGPGLTIIDGNDTTRAFVAWGDRSFNEGNENPNDSGPKGWVLEGMTIQNCVADTNNRFSYAGAAFDMLDVFADNDVDASGGLNPEEADADAGAIRLPGEDGVEGTEDDDLHRFAAMDADGNGELSEAELNAQLLSTDDEFGDENGDGGAITIHNEAVGTIQNCDFLNNHTPIAGDGDDGGAVNIAGLSVVTINDCLFNGNYACSPTGVSESDETGDADGDGSHIKVQGGSGSAITPGTTLIANRCVFLNGRAEDDGGAIQSSAVGSIIRLDACWFEGNTAADDGTVLFIGNESSGELTVTNCVFVNNISTAASDRMCQVRRNSKFINCTFVGNNQDDQDMIYNNANTADTDADGTDDEMADATQVINCIFANNVVGNGDDVLGSRNNDFTIAATNCLFFGNTLQNGNAADNTQRPDVETGSVLTDPLLDANYVPGAGSEAIDGGVDPATVGVTLTTDYNGDARPQGAAHDIGAYEAPAN